MNYRKWTFNLGRSRRNYNLKRATDFRSQDWFLPYLNVSSSATESWTLLSETYEVSQQQWQGLGNLSNVESDPSLWLWGHWVRPEEVSHQFTCLDLGKTIHLPVQQLQVISSSGGFWLVCMSRQPKSIGQKLGKFQVFIKSLVNSKLQSCEATSGKEAICDSYSLAPTKRQQCEKLFSLVGSEL